MLPPSRRARKEGKEHGGQHEKGGKPDKEKKQHKHVNGKDLLGEKIRTNGQHKLQEHGKHTAYVDVRNGKIIGVKVKHADKGDVPVKKYKTNKKMADLAVTGIQAVSLRLAQSDTYLGTTWIGYAYYDEWGEEVIYWFPYEMIQDGVTGAVEYFPSY